MKSKLIQKIKTSALSLFVAIAMILSANFSSVYAMVNYSSDRTDNFASAVYTASNNKTYNFISSDTDLTYKGSGNSSNYKINRYVDITNASSSVKDNGYYPIVKYNGVTSIKSERDAMDEEALEELDTIDNYIGMIATNNFQVASKNHTDEFETVTISSEDVKVIYVSVSNKSASDFEARATELKGYISTLNTNSQGTKYVYLDTDVDYYDSQDYESINTDSEAYNKIKDDFAALTDDGEDAIDLTGYKFSNRKLFEYAEYTLRVKTSDNKIKLAFASYYVVSCWVYTAGDATATIAVTGTNINAKIENISTNGLWVKYYLFIETPSSKQSSSAKEVSTTISLYYGDETGVTGSKKLSEYAGTYNDTNNEDFINYGSVTGTVAFDSLSVDAINPSEYYAQTINGYTANEIAIASLADGYSTANIKNSYKNFTHNTIYVTADNLDATAVSELEGALDSINTRLFDNLPVYVYLDSANYDSTIYKQIPSSETIKTEVNNAFNVDNYKFYTKLVDSADNAKVTETTNKTYFSTYANESELSQTENYSARYNVSGLKYGDQSFQSFTNNQTNDALIYNYNDTTSLDYNEYLDMEAENIANHKNYMFSYYVPRYVDDGTVSLTKLQKTTYRNKYSNNSLVASVVKEETEFDGYTKDVIDEFGNKVTEEDADGKEVTSTTDDNHNNTFVTSATEKNYILKLANDSSYDLGVTTSSIKIPALSFYRISVWAYSESEDAIATAKIFSTIYERTSAELGTLILTSAEATDFEYNSNSTNGWKEIVFYIQGNPYQDYTVNLSLLASANDTVYFDNIRVENVSSSAYSSGDKKLSLASNGILTSNVKDGLFNAIEVSTEDMTASYPYKASNWTIDSSKTSDNVVSGIVSANQTIFKTALVPAYNEDGEIDYFNKEFIVEENDVLYYKPTDGSVYELVKVGSTPTTTTFKYYNTDYQGRFVKLTTLSNIFDTNNVPVTYINDYLESLGLSGSYGANEVLPYGNVYGVYLPANDEDNSTFFMKNSSSLSLSSNAVYKLTFQVWVSENFTGTVVANLLQSSDTISNIEIANTSLTANSWTTVTFYIRTGNTSRSSISLQLGATDSTGSVFFQNVHNVEFAEITNGNQKISINDQYNELLSTYNNIDEQDNNFIRFVDMQNNNFTMHATTKGEDTSFYESYSYKAQKEEKDKKYTIGSVGVVDTNTSPAFKFNGEDVVVDSNANDVTSTALLIRNEVDTNYTVASSTFSTTLSSKKYYKVSFYALTSDLGNNGLKATINGINEHFNSINTYVDEQNNEWAQYTVYVAVGSSSITSFSISFTLGEDDGTSFTGWALVSNIAIDEIKEAEYTADVNNEDIKNSENVIIKDLLNKAEDDKDEEDEAEFSWSTFFLVFSSILLVVALVIALVSFINKRKAKKIALDAATQGGFEKPDDQETGGIK